MWTAPWPPRRAASRAPAPTSSTNSQNVRIGADADLNQPKGYFRGDLAEVVVYDRLLSAAERQQVFDWLDAKWFQTTPWQHLGYGLAGAKGVPGIGGRGSLVAGTTVEIDLGSAPTGGIAALVIGASPLFAPLLGGTLVPSPDILVSPAIVDAGGNSAVSFPMPGGVPGGATVWCQWWVLDSGAPQGFSASPALAATTP